MHFVFLDFQKIRFLFKDRRKRPHNCCLFLLNIMFQTTCHAVYSQYDSTYSIPVFAVGFSAVNHDATAESQFRKIY